MICNFKYLDGFLNFWNGRSIFRVLLYRFSGGFRGKKQRLPSRGFPKKVYLRTKGAPGTKSGFDSRLPTLIRCIPLGSRHRVSARLVDTLDRLRSRLNRRLSKKPCWRRLTLVKTSSPCRRASSKSRPHDEDKRKLPPHEYPNIFNIDVFLVVFGVISWPKSDKTALRRFLLAARRQIARGFPSAPPPRFFYPEALRGGGLRQRYRAAAGKWVHGGGALFIGSRRSMPGFSRTKEECEPIRGAEGITGRAFRAVAWKSFMVIFIAEWADLTQIATPSFAARYRDVSPSPVLLRRDPPGVRFWCVTGIAVFARQKAGIFAAGKLQKSGRLCCCRASVCFHRDACA